MRTIIRFAAPLALLFLCACAVQPAAGPAAPPAAAAAPEITPDVPAMTEAEILSGLNMLVNDTEPGSDLYASRRAALAAAANSTTLSRELRWPLAQVLAFTPPQLRQRWEQRQKAQDDAATLYAENPPENLALLNGARVVRRLGPALYLVRLGSDDSVLLNTTRRRKNGARLKGVYAAERQRPQPDKAKGDLVDELADQPRVFDEISKQEAKRRESLRAPALAQLRSLQNQGRETDRAVAADLSRLDTMTRDINAVISPALLPQGPRPAPAGFIRKVKRMAKTYSRGQYYRYALPITGKPQVDAALMTYLEERRADVQGLLKATGVGRGRSRANADRIAFTAYTASPRHLSIRFEEFRDTGGAHPNTAYASFVFDTDRQARLGLKDIFRDTPAALAVLSDLALRRMEMVLDGTMFPEGLAPKIENFDVFVLDGADMVFTFPPYQVASYAQGAQVLRVPLCHPRLMPLLRPEFLAALAAD